SALTTAKSLRAGPTRRRTARTFAAAASRSISSVVGRGGRDASVAVMAAPRREGYSIGHEGLVLRNHPLPAARAAALRVAGAVGDVRSRGGRRRLSRGDGAAGVRRAARLRLGQRLRASLLAADPDPLA